jgi:hypothetical protein
MNGWQILGWVIVALLIVNAVGIWAMLCLNGRTVGHPEDDPSDRLTQL